MNLVVGGTGMLGSRIAARLAEQGLPVRALVRSSSDPDKVAELRSLGAECVRGDLRDRPSLVAACQGARMVISSATSVPPRAEGDSIASVDQAGQLQLIEAAEAAGVERFVFISFPDVDIDFPLQTAKRAVEDRLRRSRLQYTVLQPTFFTEVWLSAARGFDAANATARIYGSGRNGISWISCEDVAKFVVAVLGHPRATNAFIPLGGPEALSPLDVVRLAEQIVGKPFAVEHVTDDDLRAQYDSATDSLQQSFAGLMLFYAKGNPIDMAETLRTFPVSLTSVRHHLLATALPSGQAV